MRLLRFALIGVVFGIVMTKSEAISWYRIIEMFRFESFHMYGIIGTAVVLGAILFEWIKRSNHLNSQGDPITFAPKAKSLTRYLAGGCLFGLGWAMTGACPGPMFTLVGHGSVSMVIVILSAVLGTFCYGLLRDRLPH